MSEDDDPVGAAFRGRVDLYDVATWDPRTALDRLAVAVFGALRVGGRWALVALAVVLFVAELAVVVLLVIAEPTLGVLAGISILPALALAAYLWVGDPTRREPLTTLGVTFVLAVLFATFALVVNTLTFGAVLGLPLGETALLVLYVGLFFVVVGPVEEAVKLLAVRIYPYRRPEFDAVVDGVVYGAVAGLGFATIENTLYIVQTYAVVTPVDPVTPIEGAVGVATSRAFVGPGHVIFSAFAGYYLGLARFNPGRRGPIVVKGLLIAGTIHALYNTAVSVLPLSGLGFVAFVIAFDGFWLAVLYRKVRRYKWFYHRIGRAEAVVDQPGGSPRE